MPTETLVTDPRWYKDAIIYELHVRAFCDGNGDGIGDFEGLYAKLDYLQDLGVTAIWLLPFYPSPLRDDGYDIADYNSIHPNYGSMKDFKIFLREAHHRGLRVITELVINHTSAEHPWFQRARHAAPGSPHREFYVWSDTAERYSEARIIFQDFESSNWSWDSVAKAYYWHRFYSHQPDLNYDNPRVHKVVLQAMDYWFGMGVDGMRLDAIPYLYQREGTNCENLPETHRFLKKLRKHIDTKHPGRMVLAEANQWPEDAVAYFGDGDECHMAFHFPVMPRMFMALQLEDRFPILDILEQTPGIPETTQWALFLRNHDELTLEMVTDEDRDYMYRTYASDPRARVNLGIRRRLAPLLESRRKIELLNALLFSLPGTPVLYYGDELGMGDNIYLGDRNGVRTPMQWSGDRNAGFSRANPQQLYLPVIVDPEYHYEAINVEAQQRNPHSLLWWMKRAIALRKRYPVFGRGTLEFLHPDNPKILAFVRSHGNQLVLVVANLSRFVQHAELDLSAFNDMLPVELFGQSQFPRISKKPYPLSFGPHTFFWFELTKPTRSAAVGPDAAPVLSISGDPSAWFSSANHAASIEEILPAYLKTQRWFGGRSRRVKAAKLVDEVSLPIASPEPRLCIVEVTYQDDRPETYLLPLAVAPQALEVAKRSPGSVLATVHCLAAVGPETEDWTLYDATANPEFSRALTRWVAGKKKARGAAGVVHAEPAKILRQLIDGIDGATVTMAERSNSSAVLGDKLVLKLFRRLHEGESPDLELSHFLTEKRQTKHVPALVGSVTYRRERGDGLTLAMLHEHVANQGDAWQHTIEALRRFYDDVLATAQNGTTPPPLPYLPSPGPAVEVSRTLLDPVGAFLTSAELMGRRTAEVHAVLASDRRDKAFVPEYFTTLYQRSLYQSVRSTGMQSFQRLDKAQRTLPKSLQPIAKILLTHQPEFQRRAKAITGRKIHALRIRCHGDLHLGQMLFTGNDFAIIDFEGEPARSIGERRLKRSPLRDVAGVLRSFDYAARFALSQAGIRKSDVPLLEPWADAWVSLVCATFVDSYCRTARPADLVPEAEDLAVLLDVFLLEKAIYELGCELDNRRSWVHVPLKGLLRLLAAENRDGHAS